MENIFSTRDCIVPIIKMAFGDTKTVEVCKHVDVRGRVMVRIFRNLSKDQSTFPTCQEAEALAELVDYKNYYDLREMDRPAVLRAIAVARAYPEVRLYITFRGNHGNVSISPQPKPLALF